MAAVEEEGMEDSPELTPAELEMVTANERAGLVSHLACHFCGLEFDVKKTRTLRAHIEEVHVLGESGYMCGMCCEEFTSRKAVETHMSTFHRTPKPLGCGICGETFRIRNMLLKHLDSHSQREIDDNKVGLCYCGECFEFFESVSTLHAHTMVHREQAVYVCGACGLRSQHRHIMVKHLECHVISNLLEAGEGAADTTFEKQPMTQIDFSRVQGSDQKLDNSTNAEQETVTSEEKEINMLEDNENTSYKCGVCSAVFSNLAEALSHAESHHQENEILSHAADTTDNQELKEELSMLLENASHGLVTDVPDEEVLEPVSEEMTKLETPESLNL